ncbi:MAG: hypothetical protein AB199_03795 [Parcubacteria bacterium C7867-004]|nr:MAG: hypothetical protein AB199_03795 [Parcubacteria bacterium C7867-004]
MTIIFDFNRTIYDPETDTAVPGALEALTHFAERGMTLHLVSRREGGRDDVLDTLGVRDFFASVAFVGDKGPVIQELVSGSSGTVYVVGDYLQSEIRAGNKAGAKTIWLKRGLFAGHAPTYGTDVPWATIKHMQELIEIIP